MTDAPERIWVYDDSHGAWAYGGWDKAGQSDTNDRLEYVPRAEVDALVAAAYEAAAVLCDARSKADVTYYGPEPHLLDAVAIRALTPADARAALRAHTEAAIETALVEDQQNRTDWFNISSKLWVWLIESGAIDDMPLVEGEEDAVLQNLQNAINAHTEAAVRRALEMAANKVAIWWEDDIRAICVEDVLKRMEGEP